MNSDPRKDAGEPTPRTLCYTSSSGKRVELPLTESISTSSSSVLIDLHSLATLGQDFQSGKLVDKTKVNSYIRSFSSEDEEERNETRQLFEVLSHLICFDKAVIDVRALQSSQEGHAILDAFEENALREAISLYKFDREVYIAAGTAALRLTEELRGKTPFANERGHHFLQQVLQLDDLTDLDDYIHKDMCDGYINHHFGEKPFSPAFSIGNSGQSAERLFVYLEAAASLDIPATLSIGKYQAAEKLGSKLLTSLRKNGASGLGKDLSGLEKIQSLVSKAALRSEHIPVPPLPGHILKFALEHRCSVIDATKKIRNDPCAVAFREWLWLKRRLLQLRLPGEFLENKMVEAQLEEVGKRIAREGQATGIFINRTKKAVLGSRLPLLGELLNALGLSDDLVGLPIITRRNPPMYEIFMASWFAADARPLTL